jgi:ABC-type phosphate transport system substrate-binding protein
MKIRFRYCLMLCTVICTSSAWADVVVVVSARSSVTRLNADHIAKIFLGKINTYPSGGNAVPLDQPEGSVARDEFYLKVANKSAAQLTAYWAKVIFTGDGYPPRLLEGNSAVKRAVAGNPNAIGYIEKSVVDSSVRVILEP